jgi:molybdopterin/thiamine biosynthesis adenylyltransferase
LAGRYSRQTRFPPIGEAGQARLRAARVLVLGVGALGSVIAEQLCRAGVGRLRLVDRDFVEPSNLQRQSLYTEADAAAATPKALAAARHLARINGDVAVEAVVDEVSSANVRDLVAGCDLALDGADNFAVRHLLNEACCAAGIPWIYAACVGAYALSLPIVPGSTPCLRCLQDELPMAGDGPTCDSGGIIAPAVHLAAAWAVTEALRLLVGDRTGLRRELWASDLWAGTFQRLDVSSARDPRCPVCGPHPTYPALSAPREVGTVLCGRDAVQIGRDRPVDLAAFAVSLGASLLQRNDYMVRWSDGPLTGTCFRDGRILVQGTGDVSQARSFADRWLG